MKEKTLNIKSKVSEKIKHSDHDNSLSKWKSTKVKKKFERLKICKKCVGKMTQNSEVKMYYFKKNVKFFYFLCVQYLLSIVVLYIVYWPDLV